jgi:AcrR family transcriptional regulator
MNKRSRTQDSKRLPRPKGTASRKAPLDRAGELARVALDLFAKRNFASVTIKDIANATGVNTALIYYYFESKDDLFRAVIEHAVDQAFNNFRLLRERHQNPADVINDWLNNHVQLFEPIHKLVKISLDYSGAQKRVPSIDRSIRQFYDEEARMLSNCIRQGISEGIFQPVDPEREALFISTYLDGLMVRSVILPETDLERAVDQLRMHIRETLGVADTAQLRAPVRPPTAATG